MIANVRAFFDRYLATTAPEQDDDHRLQIASAALMIELINADHETSPEEEAMLDEILVEHFQLSAQEKQDLIDLAHTEKHEATDYYRFTSLLNQHYSQQDKIDLVENLWRLAYADRHIDKFEEHLIRRLADLLHVPHADFMQAKHRATDA